MSKQARTAVKQIAKLLGALGPSFLRTDGGEAERIIDAQFGRYSGPSPILSRWALRRWMLLRNNRVTRGTRHKRKIMGNHEWCSRCGQSDFHLGETCQRRLTRSNSEPFKRNNLQPRPKGRVEAPPNKVQEWMRRAARHWSNVDNIVEEYAEIIAEEYWKAPGAQPLHVRSDREKELSGNCGRSMTDYEARLNLAPRAGHCTRWLRN